MSEERSEHQMGAAEDVPMAEHCVHIVETRTFTYFVQRPLFPGVSTTDPEEVLAARAEAERRYMAGEFDERRDSRRPARWAFASSPRR